VPNCLETNLNALRARIEQALARARRPAGDVQLVAVTKSVAPGVALDLARLLARSGLAVELGESRVSELERKAAACAEARVPARWHLIGHLQRNKARRALQHAQVLHSVDSPRLLAALERIAAESGRRVAVYLEVELSGIAGRTGLGAGEVAAAVRHARELARVELVGLMTMGPPPEAGASASRAVFARLRELRDELARELPAAFGGRPARLSMGMTSDLEAAILEGSDCVRVGSALFEGVVPDGVGVQR
jgi:hypothetical protein